MVPMSILVDMYDEFFQCFFVVYYMTPLHYAALNGKLEVVNYLIEHGANINCVDIYGKTPLHMAAANGYIGTVKCLLDNGAKVDSIDYIYFLFTGLFVISRMYSIKLGGIQWKFFSCCISGV